MDNETITRVMKSRNLVRHIETNRGERGELQARVLVRGCVGSILNFFKKNGSLTLIT